MGFGDQPGVQSAWTPVRSAAHCCSFQLGCGDHTGGGVFLLEDPWRGPEEACLSWPARGAASTLGHVSLLFKLV